MGEQVLSTAVGQAVTWTMNAAVDRHDARASVDKQLWRLETLIIAVRATVHEAEGVHIRSWWLRRWLWRLRDTAVEGDEVLRLFKQRRAAEAAAAAANLAGNNLWNAARRALQSAKSLLFPSGGDNNDVHRLSCMVERLEMVCTGISDFSNLLKFEIRRSQPEPELKVHRFTKYQAMKFSFAKKQVRKVRAEDGNPSRNDKPPTVWSSTNCTIRNIHGTDFDHEVFYISRGEYVASMKRIGLLMVRDNIRRAIVKLIALAAMSISHLPTQEPGMDRRHALVTSACGSVKTSGREADYGQLWLDEWHRELQAVVDRADSAGCAYLAFRS